MAPISRMASQINCLAHRSQAKVPRRANLRPEVAMKMTRNIGMLLLALWLIVTGLVPLLRLSFNGLPTVMAILAIAAGVLIAIGR
jgi:hypothetical protein